MNIFTNERELHVLYCIRKVLKICLLKTTVLFLIPTA